MSASPIRIPASLTTEGLLGRRYMARFIDSIIVSSVGERKSREA